MDNSRLIIRPHETKESHPSEILTRVNTNILGQFITATSHLILDQTPRMLHHLRDRMPLIDLPVQHCFDKINAGLAHDPRNAELVVHDLVDAVKGVFFIH